MFGLIPESAKLFPPLAGLVGGATSSLFTNEFWQALIVAAVTGLLTLIGTVLGAWLAARISHHLTADIRQDVQDIKQSTGTDRRASDHREDE